MPHNTGIEVLSTADQSLAALGDLAAWAEDLSIMSAWATAARGKARHWQLLPLDRVRRALIGIHFAQSEPWVLRTLASKPGRLQVIEDTAGVFHPKLIIGTKGGHARAIVGSSNFTTGGFGGNTELNLLVSGSIDLDPLRQLISSFDSEWTSARTQSVDSAWLDRYEAIYERRPRPPRLPKQNNSANKVEIESPDDLDVEWNAYYKLIAARERHALADGFEIHVFDHDDGSYLQEIDACRRVFERTAVFEDTPLADRKLVTGWGPDTTGHFGRNVGAGYFKKLVGSSPRELGRHLDRVPLEGEVNRALAEEVLNGLISIHGVALGVASRMITVKRPDLFVTLNNANKPQVKAIFGRAPTKVSTYLDWIERIWEFPWFSSPEPVAGRDEGRVWRARVALMDALIYELRT